MLRRSEGWSLSRYSRATCRRDEQPASIRSSRCDQSRDAPALWGSSLSRRVGIRRTCDELHELLIRQVHPPVGNRRETNLGRCPLNREPAIRELAEKGETDKIPRYRNSMSMLAYARSVEDYCGYAPGGAFQIVDGKWLNFTHKMVRDAAAAAAEQRSWASFACVKRIVEATDLGRYFIGNRARSQPRPAV